MCTLGAEHSATETDLQPANAAVSTTACADVGADITLLYLFQPLGRYSLRKTMLQG